jgi:hypothetical protein
VTKIGKRKDTLNRSTKLRRPGLRARVPVLMISDSLR